MEAVTVDVILAFEVKGTLIIIVLSPEAFTPLLMLELPRLGSVVISSPFASFRVTFALSVLFAISLMILVSLVVTVKINSVPTVLSIFCKRVEYVGLGLVVFVMM